MAASRVDRGTSVHELHHDAAATGTAAPGQSCRYLARSLPHRSVHDAAALSRLLSILLTYLSSSKKYDGKKEAKTPTSSFHLLISQKK